MDRQPWRISTAYVLGWSSIVIPSRFRGRTTLWKSPGSLNGFRASERMISPTRLRSFAAEALRCARDKGMQLCDCCVAAGISLSFCLTNAQELTRQILGSVKSNLLNGPNESIRDAG